jgi:hypothetical protein
VSFATTPGGQQLGSRSWQQLTALQSLDLVGCTVHPEAVQALSHLRALALVNVEVPHPAATPEALVRALSELTLLTQLIHSFMSHLAHAVRTQSVAITGHWHHPSSSSLHSTHC